MRPELQRIQMDSIYTYLDNMNLHELCDLLAVKTSALLTMLHQKGENRFIVRDLQTEVEKIQEAIRSKKAESINNVKGN
jgi:glycerate kinase